jgi:hypothetical protein
MLRVTIPANEYFDEVKNEFIQTKEQTLQLEHSLLSLSKWEQTWKKPFLKKGDKSAEESCDYVRCMTINKDVDPSVYSYIPQSILSRIAEYIDDPHTATTFNNQKSAPNREIITSEVIYYWMTALQIPFECQKWHLNNLLTLIQVCNIKNAPAKKMSKRDLASRNRALNAARRSQSGSMG